MNTREWQPLTIPRVAWNKETVTATFGECIAEPLAPGFGITIGNALRRVLLGSIEGSAVTSIIIRGVNNEFSTIPGVVEDSMQLVLNIKEIIIRNKTGQAGVMRLLVEKPGPVKVGDIQADGHLELVNTDFVLAHVAEGGSLEIQFFVESGRGYQPAQWPNGVALQKDDRIYVDAMFSPIRRVTFDVHKTRVGGDIDYDQLRLSVMTNGAEEPIAAVHYAVSVLRAQLEHFLTNAEIPFNDFSSSHKAAPIVNGKDVQGTALSADLLLKPVDALEFSVRANNCLINAGVKRIIDLVNLSEDDVLKIKNFGRKSFEEVKEGMKAFGLSFGMNITEESLKKQRKKDVV